MSQAKLLFTINEAIMSQISDSDMQEEIEDSLKSSGFNRTSLEDSDSDVVLAPTKRPSKQFFFGPKSIQDTEKVVLSGGVTV